ncbi:MAG: hypothetical protein KAR38_14290, partial [Calditrichia bacterium]|nr:hypothetical protein [Calditrichia bacterium]
MKTRYLIKTILITAFLLPLTLQAVTYSTGLQAGYNGGPGLYLNGEISDFALNFPFKFRLGIGYSKINNP